MHHTGGDVIAAAIVAGLAFAAWGGFAERVASVWPADEATRRPPGWRTGALALAAGVAGGALVWRSQLPLWATAAYLAFLALLIILTATDLEQRRLPHLVLDPLIVGAVLFVPFNPAVAPLDALVGAGVAIGFLGLLGLIIRGGLAIGDLYLVAPLGLLLGWPAIFAALFMAALLAGVTSVILLVSRRVGMKSYIPFGPFLVAGAILALLREPQLLSQAVAVLGA
jgi:leader peptidase (prepilin peptidase) / N-methyltransferase